MLKVICINGNKEGDFCTDGFNTVFNDEVIYEGDIYTVIGECGVNNRSYRLKERPTDIIYLKSRFIPLSSIDEREIKSAREATCTLIFLKT